MYYYKRCGTYVASLNEIPNAEPITEEEYARIKAIIKSQPAAPEGYAYRLTPELEWELYQLQVVDTDAEATTEDYLAALAEMGVDV